MIDYNREDQFLRQRLQKEIPILRALIQNLYEELDRKLHLNGAKVPITFGFDTDTLGSYTRRSAHEKEHFACTSGPRRHLLAHAQRADALFHGAGCLRRHAGGYR